MLQYFMDAYLPDILMAIVVGISGMLALAVQKFLSKHLNTEMKMTVARTAQKFVEQIFKDIHGQEKLDMALKTAAELLAAKGIKFDKAEMIILIEAAVAEWNAQPKPELPEKAQNYDACDDACEDYPTCDDLSGLTADD